MGHNISGIILRGPVAQHVAEQFHLTAVALPQGFVILPVGTEWVDHWSEALHLEYESSAPDAPLINAPSTREIAHQLNGRRLFALIETDYFGGVGSQRARVYKHNQCIAAPAESGIGPINQALRLLGVIRKPGSDEFESIDLHLHRNFNQIIEAQQDRYRTPSDAL